MNYHHFSNHGEDMEQEKWMGMYRHWNNQDERRLIKLYYAEHTFEDIAKELNREGLEVVLRLIELLILDTDTLAKIWDDYSERAKAA